MVKHLKHNKPFDEQILSWLQDIVGVSKISYLDAKVKRKWPTDYLYELLGYSHDGYFNGKINFPKRRVYDKRPNICNKIGLRKSDYDLIDLLKQDDEFQILLGLTRLQKLKAENKNLAISILLISNKSFVFVAEVHPCSLQDAQGNHLA